MRTYLLFLFRCHIIYKCTNLGAELEDDGFDGGEKVRVFVKDREVRVVGFDGGGGAE